LAGCAFSENPKRSQNPERVAALEDDVPGVLAIVVVTDAKHGREQGAQYTARTSQALTTARISTRS